MSAEPLPSNFLDTNVLVYAYDRSAGDKHTVAVKLVEQLWENETGSVSLQVLQEFYVTVTRKIAKPLEFQTARQIVEDLAHWRLHIPEVNDLIQAIDFQQKYHISIWNAMIIESATHLGCKQLLSEDLSHGQVYGGVQVINPFRGSN